ncbi:hypothetical protein CGQ24_10925 [Arthrobacter sp. 7749]|nr:hypothetical protein CGQ24_10925 [Arthrobacter sp. 7749]
MASAGKRQSFARIEDTVIEGSMDRLIRNLDDPRSRVLTLTGLGMRTEFMKENHINDSDDSPELNSCSTPM